jgi:hypothetical protein
MLSAIARGLLQKGGFAAAVATTGVCQQGTATALQKALQAQQKRFLNIHEYQGAQLMAKFGINVPDGVPASTVDEVKRAAEAMKDDKGEVRAVAFFVPFNLGCSRVYALTHCKRGEHAEEAEGGPSERGAR